MESIGITGNPATGKKTIANELSKKLNMEIFDINKFIIENKYGQYEKDQLIISDINQILIEVYKLIKTDNDKLIIPSLLSIKARAYLYILPDVLVIDAFEISPAVTDGKSIESLGIEST